MLSNSALTDTRVSIASVSRNVLELSDARVYTCECHRIRLVSPPLVRPFLRPRMSPLATFSLSLMIRLVCTHTIPPLDDWQLHNKFNCWLVKGRTAHIGSVLFKDTV